MAPPQKDEALKRHEEDCKGSHAAPRLRLLNIIPSVGFYAWQ